MQKATHGKKTANFDDCVERHMVVMDPFHACDITPECTCKICTHQPPSLADSARHILFSYTLYIDRFKLTVEKTHQQYEYAARLNRVQLGNLLPPEAPTVRLWYRHDFNSLTNIIAIVRMPGRGIHILKKTYTSAAAMIEELFSHKEHFWCHHFGKGRFFPISCHVHGEVKEEEEEIEEIED